MNCNYIRDLAAETLIECDVKSFPLDCFQILEHYGYRIFSYSELRTKNKDAYEMCVKYSDDAFRIGGLNIIAYNDRKPRKRIRFSLIHELGHHVFDHKNDSKQNEQEANFFASNFLSPRIAMYYAKCKNVAEASELFDISTSAAYYASRDFSEWASEVARNGKHSYDSKLYFQFYNREKDKFIYSIKQCQMCGETLYNCESDFCQPVCSVPEFNKKIVPFSSYTEDYYTVEKLRNNWLYNF